MHAHIILIIASELKYRTFLFKTLQRGNFGVQAFIVFHVPFSLAGFWDQRSHQTPARREVGPPATGVTCGYGLPASTLVYGVTVRSNDSV